MIPTDLFFLNFHPQDDYCHYLIQLWQRHQQFDLAQVNQQLTTHAYHKQVFSSE
jgi:hypothetical protein